MSTIATRSTPLYDLLSPAQTRFKQPPKRDDPLSLANPPALTQADKPGEPDSPAQQYARAREAAEGLVATSFIKPILTQVRESNNAPPPFGPTQAEKQFGSLLDNKLSDEIVRASQFPIVDRIVERFTRNLEQPRNDNLDLKA